MKMKQNHVKFGRYLKVDMNSLFCFVSFVNPGSKSRNVMPSVRFSSDVKVIFSILRMLCKKSLRSKNKFKVGTKFIFTYSQILNLIELASGRTNEPARSHKGHC